MRKKHFALLLITLFSFATLGYSSSNSTEKNIPTQGTIGYSSDPTAKILRQGWEYYQWSAQKFVSVCDVYQCHYDYLDQARAIKAIRPDILVFLYRNTITVWTSASQWEYDAAQEALFKANNWILKDSSGNLLHSEGGSGWLVDFGNPDYHTWLGNWFQGYINSNSIDGVEFDNWFCGTDVFYSHPSSEGIPINPRTGAAWTDAQVEAAFKAMVARVRQIIGSKLILVNGAYNGVHFYDQGRTSYYTNALTTESLDAVMCEGLFSTYDANAWYSESQWLESINLTLWLEDNFHGTILLQQSTDTAFFDYPTPQFPADMTEAQYEQYVTFCYASRLLTIKRLTTFMSFGLYIDHDYPQSLFKINLGDPVASYYKDANNLYVRNFTNGQVKVNPSASVRGGLAAHSAQLT